MNIKKRIFIFGLIFAASFFASAQKNLKDIAREDGKSTRSGNASFAEEEFRRGVQSYYRGAFNESILEFEKALSYLPGEPLVLDWLGKAYYKAGIEGAALQQWNYAKELGYGGILLQNRIEIVSDRRITDESILSSQKYTETGSFPHINENKKFLYSRPISVLANKDGSIWVAAYASNELVKFDVNGSLIKRSRGSIGGLDRPMDVIRLSNGDLAVSEFAGDRISILGADGSFKKTIGSKGRGEGQFVGPQYLAEDEYGNIYVSDFGNSRITVLDAEGKGLLSFGAKTQDFAGFKSPTGIAVCDERVFVADSISGAIYEFDRSGNYTGILVNEKTFVRPESIKIWGTYLLVTDRDKIYIVDTGDGSVYECAGTGKGSSLTSAVFDRNGNIVVTDFKNNEVCILSKMTELVGGFFVQFERVDTSKFPEVTVEVRVENRSRQPVVGLNEQNFVITENKQPVQNLEYLGSSDSNDIADVTIIIDRNVSMRKYREQLDSAVQEITASMAGKGTVNIVTCGDVPVLEYTGSPLRLSEFSSTSLKNGFTENASLDLALRLASNGLINAERKRGIIYITAGDVSQQAFTKYAISDLTTFMNNNAISFSTILLNQSSPAKEITYITESTNGQIYYIYRPEGLSSVIKDIIDLPSGLYLFRYESQQKTEYGLKYLPVEIETYLLNRSGRDETGYFTPLE